MDAISMASCMIQQLLAVWMGCRMLPQVLSSSPAQNQSDFALVYGKTQLLVNLCAWRSKRASPPSSCSNYRKVSLGSSPPQQLVLSLRMSLCRSLPTLAVYSLRQGWKRRKQLLNYRIAPGSSCMANTTRLYMQKRDYTSPCLGESPCSDTLSCTCASFRRYCLQGLSNLAHTYFSQWRLSAMAGSLARDSALRQIAALRWVSCSNL